MKQVKKTAQEVRAILVTVNSTMNEATQIAIDEFKSLVASDNITILDTVIQKRPLPDPKYIVGKGKLHEIYIKALALDANLIIFDHEMSPSQARSISDFVDIKVVDRTQIILDIFAKRAHTMEGKIQVELALHKYNMPRLVGKNPYLSRIGTGGSAGGGPARGPGETKLEIDRRRAKERITKLEKEINIIKEKRRLKRHSRQKNQIPVISIIGYTNTGKSTLLNTLTNSDVLAADMPFATLDPSSKRLRFPRDFDVVITDTVGFIRDLPEDLRNAFMATLEELEYADLLLEVIDASDPHFLYRIQAVDEILRNLGLHEKQRIKVFNKADKCDKEYIETISSKYGGLTISAINRATLKPLIEKMESFFIKDR